MSRRRTLKHLDKVIRDQKVAPVSADLPCFLFGTGCDMPIFAEHQICATFYEGPLAEMKMAEWEFAPARASLATAALSDLQLEPLA